jgi:DNA-binding transcriptional MerR regulator
MSTATRTAGATGECSSLRQAGYLTVSEVARALGIGVTTLRRRETAVYPRATRMGGIRIYRRGDLAVLTELQARLRGSLDLEQP